MNTLKSTAKEGAYVAFLQKYLKDKNPDAMLFILGYGLYVHAIDDIIDGDKTDSEFILKTFELAPIVYSNPFYIRNLFHLYPLVKMASNTYMDSVQLEKSNSNWRRNMADTLRQNGNEVILAVIELVCGYDTRRQASMELREISYKSHHNEEGVPC